MDIPCSLEHCHTNLFALQNLNEMKWKCFRRSLTYRLDANHSGRLDNYKDPVLQAYWNSLHADILCAWKRVPTEDGQKIERELWLFAISEDLPSDLPNLRAVTETLGSWSQTGMSYDCRTMLFKALHNMIEKYLLSKGFARLNKWFVLPVNGHSDVKVPNFSFNFHFFLHGDNKVCASVDVQRHQHIFNLTAKDLEGTSRTNVILAPYGINGMLIGPVNREMDLNALRDNWEKNYPIRHLDGLPDFVEVTTGNARMFYPTCYVYKIGTNDPSTSNNSNETNSTNKKSEISTTKKSKSIPVNLTPSLDTLTNTNKIESALIKDFANNLLISAQRNNAIDFEKRSVISTESSCIIDDSVNHQLCRCHQPVPNNTRQAPFIPFHRRPRAIPLTTSDSSVRNKVETNKTQNPSESLENPEILTESTSSPMINTNPQPTTNEKSTDWTASTPASVGLNASPSVLPSIPNHNSVSSSSPAPNQSSSVASSSSTRGLKRSATIAFEEIVADDEERERQRQTYDFNRTDFFLQLPLKRFRPETPFNRSRINSTTDASEQHVYLHGQPTPPSPGQPSFRPTTDFEEDESTSRTNSPPVTTVSNLPSFYPTTGPSMDDLITILEPTNPVTTSDQNVKSPARKDHTSLPPPPPPSVPTISINNNIYPLNKSFNGVYHHEIEQIYNTPPGSSSSEKLQVLHSPYAIIADTASHVPNAFDRLNQLSHESILAPFESNIVTEQSAYHSINKLSIKKAEKRYEPKKSSSTIASTRPKTFRHWKSILPSSSEISSSPFSNQHLLRQQPTPTIYSPMRSVDVQPSPYLTRSVGSVPMVNSPLAPLPLSVPEIDSLMLNVLLNDSILNLYRDINFDSCVLCACTSNELSIHGIDSLIYLEKSREQMKSNHSHGYSHELSYAHSTSLYSQQPQAMTNSCSCGFSAVVNLRLSCASGLFYEDEIEITGMKTEVKYRQLTDPLSVQLLEFIERKESFTSPFDSLHRQNFSKKSLPDSLQILKQPFHHYENLACRLAIDQARNHSTTPVADDIERHQWLHQWSYSNSPLDSDQQLITMLRSLQPLLVEALKKRHVNGLWSTIDGPLTWKSFHQLLYAQKQHAYLEEQISGPQPIPYVLTGFDREWITLAPYGLKFWDKLCLEPYSKRKDIGYICLVPDNDYVCSTTKTYMRELSSYYELCRLGSHRPLLKAFPDQGLLRISSRNNESTQLPNIDPWFTDHENSHPLGSRLKLYAQIFKEKLSNVLSNQSFDNPNSDENSSRRDVFRAPNDLSSVDLHSSSNDVSNPNSSLSPSSSNLLPNNIYTTGSTSTDVLSISTSNGTSVNGQQVDAFDLQAFDSFYHGRSLNDEQLFIVIYLVDTFRYELTANMSNENENLDVDIYVKKAIFRAYMDLMKDLPEKISMRVHIQIIPFESIVNHQIDSDSELRVTQFKRLSFHIYDQLRRTVSYSTRAKSLTGFGPAASEEKDPTKLVMQLYTPSYILSPKSDFRFKSFSDHTEQSNNNGSILYCSYCLSDDQRYLLATCSDDRGELLETCSINIEVPDRHRRKVQYARKVGLQRLWDFIMRIITSTTMPWRIVVGRLGRLGHGELKSWGIILSKKNLVRYATIIRESCPMCHILRSHDHPVILSACLISMETHPLLTVLPESFELGEMRGTQPSNNTNAMQNTGQVLNDISVTHILTLPTSASVQHVQSNTRAHGLQQLSMDQDEDLFGPLFGVLDVDLIDNMPSPPPDLELAGAYGLDMNHSGNLNGGHLSRLNSLSISQTNFNGTDAYGNSLNSSGARSNSLLHLVSDVDMNDIPTLQEQPLALGFYVSTIGTLNPLPIWMLQGRSNLRSNNSSSVFKATLHVSVPNAQHSDDMFFAQNQDQKSMHPLDSNYTSVVLRHVLESYHRLSWLLIDAKTNERASCLPIHMETLLRLYHAFIKFV